MWLDEKYIMEISSTLDQFKKKQHGLYNFRCPICGDSDKSKLKARGYFYTRDNKVFYNCKNCGASMTFYSFLKDHDFDAWRRYKMELFKESVEKKDVPKKKVLYKNKKVVFNKIHELLKSIDKVSSLSDDHIAIKYLKSRLIPRKYYNTLFFVNKLTDLTQNIKKYKDHKFDSVPRIVIPFYNKDKQLTHLGCRAIGKSDLRYVTLTLDDYAPKIYGLDRVDFTKTIYITEGQFDSMFLPNAVAMGGSDLTDTSLLGDNIVFVMDNEPRNKAITNKLKKLIKSGYSVVIWGKTDGKDINEMLLNGMDESVIIEHIKNHTYNGLKAEMKFVEYKK